MGLEQLNWDEIALEAVATLEPVEPSALVDFMGTLATATASPDALPRSWGEDANGAVSRIKNGGLVEQAVGRTWRLTSAGETELDRIDAARAEA